MRGLASIPLVLIVSFSALSAGGAPAPASEAKLMFDHVERTWSAEGARMKVGLDGRPVIDLPKGVELKVVVTKTNPLLYSIGVGEAKKEEIEQLAALRKLAKLLGGSLQAVLKGLPTFGVAAPSPVDLHLATLKADLTEMRKAVERASCHLDAIEDGTRQAIFFVQQLELGHEGTYTFSTARCGEAPISGETLRDSFDTLSSLWRTSTAADEGCTAIISAYSKLQHEDPSKPDELAEKIEAYEAAAMSHTCGGKAASLIAELGQRVEAIESAIAHQSVMQKLLAEERTKIDAIVLVSSQMSDGEKLLGGEPAAQKALARIELFERRLRPNIAVNPIPATVRTSDVKTTIAVATNTAPKWDSIVSYPFEIVIDSPYESAIEAARASKIETGYRIVPASSKLWDVSAGVIVTGIDAPVFGVIDDGGTRRIGKTDEATRSGELAAFVDWAAGRTWCRTQCESSLADRFGLQLGVATGSDPAFFFGPSVRFGKWARLGGGWTTQRVKGLAGGQRIGQEITSEDAIQRRDTFDDSWYLSFNLSLGAVKLFSVD